MKKYRIPISATELTVSAAFLIVGVVDLISGEPVYKGYPLPFWTAYLHLAIGISLPILALLLRKPPKNDDR